MGDDDPYRSKAENMFLNLKRILLNEVDSGSGNGAAAPSATEPVSVPQAQGDAVTLSKAQLDELVSTAAKQAAKAAHDAAFAEARRTFTGSKKDKAPKADEAGAPSTAQLSASDERMFLRGLDRELSKLGISPNSAQYARAERDLLADRPDDVSSWAKDYFDGWGNAKPISQTATNQTASATKPVSEHPVSNRGAPPPAQTPIEEMDLFSASESDRAAFIKSKGPKAYVSLLQKQAKGRTIKFT